MNETPAPADKGARTDIEIDFIALRSCLFEDLLFAHTMLDAISDDESATTGEHASGEGMESEADAGEQAGDESADIQAEINVWLDDAQAAAMVQLIVHVQPKQQPTWRAMVDMFGKYSARENPVLPLPEFARTNGVAYLVPYVRERLASLTSASGFDTYVLPPVNVKQLTALARRTAAARRKAAGSELNATHVASGQ